MKASSFFTDGQQDQLLASISEAEKETSGEIRIHIEKTCEEDVLDRAAWIFNKLGMEKTDQKNGVLFYLAVEDRKFAVLGDSGINSKVPTDFWDCIREVLSSNFREGKFTEGLSEGILLAGQQLKVHFPYHKDDVNELTNEISFDKLEGEKK
jgi:uncharacterized membrane protein